MSSLTSPRCSLACHTARCCLYTALRTANQSDVNRTGSLPCGMSFERLCVSLRVSVKCGPSRVSSARAASLSDRQCTLHRCLQKCTISGTTAEQGQPLLKLAAAGVMQQTEFMLSTACPLTETLLFHVLFAAATVLGPTAVTPKTGK